MRKLRALPVLVGFCCVFGLTTGSAAAQDLFELEVFEYESTPAGAYEVEFHSNGMLRESTGAGSAIANHRPIHMSVEVTADRASTIHPRPRFSPLAHVPASI